MVLLKYILTSIGIINPPEFYTNQIKYNITYNKQNNLELDQNNLQLDYQNVYNMFLMSYNTYYKINETDWNEVPYDPSYPINDTTDTTRIKGYVFSNSDNSLIFIVFKGTTLFSFKDTKTSKNDKFNDNLFYSCCYYKQHALFNEHVNRSSCENTILQNETTCFNQCYQDSLGIELNYLVSGKKIIEIFKNQKIIDFEKSKVVFVGYSLGGIIASYLGVLFNKQVITFETPGNRHYFDMINLNYKNHQNNIFNFAHNSDTIVNGNCGNLCWIFGYNMNTKCHIGKSCMYDSRTKLKLSESINYHRLTYMYSNILPQWENDLPICSEYETCSENCQNWNYI
jgi:lipase ATG15